jgi:uncharacterized protein YbjQ (UPF0145 family)
MRQFPSKTSWTQDFELTKNKCRGVKMDIQDVWKKAYDLHYKSKVDGHIKQALYLYRQIINAHPDSPEAKYSQTQVGNIINSNPDLFEDAGKSLENEVGFEITISNGNCTVCESEVKGHCENRMCSACFSKYLRENIVMTTTNNIDGFHVTKYIDIKSIEIVIGTGFFSENISVIQDIFGLRSSMFEGKLADAKRVATEQLRYDAFKAGGNAVIGVDLDFTEFSGNRVGLIMNGTVVIVEKDQYSVVELRP